ncbi:MAG: hypothetical protein NUW23_07230, partial [Firmicutes bacterium]|nr:hypothetical protein [Bacillota bacterium]
SFGFLWVAGRIAERSSRHGGILSSVILGCGSGRSDALGDRLRSERDWWNRPHVSRGGGQVHELSLH